MSRNRKARKRLKVDESSLPTADYVYGILSPAHLLSGGSGFDKRGQPKESELTNDTAFIADWNRECEICGDKPVVNATGLCGPCTFGEAETAGGNW